MFTTREAKLFPLKIVYESYAMEKLDHTVEAQKLVTNPFRRYVKIATLLTVFIQLLADG